MKTFIIWFFSILVILYSIFSVCKIVITFAPDFSIFYHAAYDMRLSHMPYTDKALFTQFNYPLATAGIFIPLTFLPYQVAQGIFVMLNFLSVFFIVAACFLLLKKKPTYLLFFATCSLVLFAFPTKFSLGMGQTNLFALALLLWGFVLLHRKRNFASVLLVLIAILAKPILITTLVVLMRQKKWGYTVSVLLCIVGIMLLVPFLFHLPTANATFFHNMVSLQTTAGRDVYYNQGLLGFISRLVPNLSLRSILNNTVTVVILGIAVFFIGRFSFSSQLSLILTTLVILDPLSWQHHFVFLIFPFLVVGFAIQKRFSSKQQTNKKYMYLTLYVLSYLLVAGNIKNPQSFLTFPFSLILSHVFFGAMTLFVLQLLVVNKDHG